MASSPSSALSANDALNSQSPVGRYHHISCPSINIHPNTSASPSQNHFHTALSSIDNHRQTSPSTGTEQSDLTSPVEELPSIASVSALETTKTSQSGFSFLSLPPEIRNMIYGFLFTPVRDRSCWAVRASFRNTSLSGVRVKCWMCSRNSIHMFCTPSLVQRLEGTFTAFTLTTEYMRSSMHQTCRTIMNESRSASLAHMLISVNCRFNDPGIKRDCLDQFLANMGQPKGAYIAGLSCTTHDSRDSEHVPNSNCSLSAFINRREVKIGHLELKECWSRGHEPDSPVEFFVSFLQSLHHKPATVRWQESDYCSYQVYNDEMNAFNEAAAAWLQTMSNLEAKESNLRMPLLRDFLPQYFDQQPNEVKNKVF